MAGLPNATASPVTGAAPSSVVDVDAGASVVGLPAGLDLGGAEYTRAGANLVIADDAGHTVVLRGFFELADPPTLTTADGMTVAGTLATRLAGPQAPGMVAQ
ncbi:MAG: hypothetical protein KDE22_09615, partial [Rhodobacterales bacterium]|nr:hypothetical protein [Rhodobacterales bacterium]